MDKISAQNIIKETFNYPFNEEKFSKFSVNLLEQIKTNSSSAWLDNTNLPLSLRENVKQYKIFGQIFCGGMIAFIIMYANPHIYIFDTETDNEVILVSGFVNYPGNEKVIDVSVDGN